MAGSGGLELNSESRLKKSDSPDDDILNDPSESGLLTPYVSIEEYELFVCKSI
jgi:hypothetical protein